MVEAINSEKSSPRWYAAYTRSRHEMISAEEMKRRAIEQFVPTYEAVRRWKDRQKRLSLPLFPGYVFVRIALDERRRVLVIPGVVRLVGFGDRPVPLDDDEIEKLRSLLSHRAHMQPHPYLKAGRTIRILRGALAGLEGVLIRRKGRVRLLMSIELIRCSATIEVDAADVEPIAGPPRPQISQ